MSLFPAFSSCSDPESCRNTEFKWLNNPSFNEESVLSLHQRSAERHTSPQHAGLQKAEEENEYDWRAKKKTRKKEKKKKQKKEKQKKEKKRSRGRSESSSSDSDTVYPSDLLNKEEEFTERAVEEERGFKWLDDLQSSSNRLFCIDRAADSANWEYKSLYRTHIARYRRKGSSVLGLDSRTQAVCWDDSSLERKRKDRRPERYFSTSVFQLLRSEALLTLPSNPTPDPTPFIPLPTCGEEQDSVPSSSPSCTQLNPLGVLDSATCLWLEGKGQPEVQQQQWSVCKSATLLTARVEEFNRKLRETPTDTHLWMQFLRFQDELATAPGVFSAGAEGEAEGRRVSARALLERKASIVERALDSNPASVELQLERLRLCRELWDQAALLKEWKKLVFIHPNSAPLWRRYVLFAQSHFGSFSVSKVLALYGKCLSTLSAVQDGSMVSHTPLPGTQGSMLDILVLQCHFLRQAGHSEKAVSLFQAMLDFTFFKPDSVKDLPTRQQVEFFEPFWDSGEPRVGERGARGWRAWMLQQERGGWVVPSQPEEDEDEEQDESEIRDKTLPRWRIWLDVEASREAKHWLPWRPDKTKGQSEEDCEDPDRQVLFDDLGSSLIRLDSADLCLRLLLSFLHFLGLPVPPELAPHTMLLDHLAPLDDEPDPERPLTCYDLPVGGVAPVGHMTWLQDSRGAVGLCKEGEEFVKNVLEQILPLLPPQHRAQVSLCWLRYEKLKVLRCVHSKNKRRIKAQGKRSKRTAKCLLKQQENRSSLALWREFGHMEWLLGNVEEARRVLDTALSLGGTRGLRDPALCELCLLYAQLEVEQAGRGRAQPSENGPMYSPAVHILMALAEGSGQVAFSGQVTPVAMLKSRKAYEQALSAWLHNTGDGDYPVARLVGCFGLFQYLTAGVDAADAVFVQAREALASGVSGDSELEKVCVQHATLLRYHAETAVAFPLSRIRLALTEALMLRPCSASLWQMYVQVEGRYHAAGRARRFFHSIIRSDPGVVPRLFAVMSEQRRKEQLDLVMRSGLLSEALPTLPETGLSNRIRSLFEAAVASEHGARCPLLWRMYMTFMVSNGDPERGKGVFYRALQEVPWVKGLYMDAVQLFPDRVQEFLDLLTEKELRLRVPMEELEILLED